MVTYSSPKRWQTGIKCMVTHVVLHWSNGNALHYALSVILELFNVW